MKAIIDHICCPVHRYTLSVRAVRQWVEDHCEGSVLNLFAGITRLNVEEIRNDLDEKADADVHMDPLIFLQSWDGRPFDTILLAPSQEQYPAMLSGPYRAIKDALVRHLKPAGKVISFGYHTVVMGETRGFELEKVGVFSHGGITHDTIVSIERFHL